MHQWKIFINLEPKTETWLNLLQVSDDWDECKTELERRLYLIKNMEKLNKESKPYKTGEYEDMFKASEIASMAAEDIVAYRNSIMIEMERQSELEFAKDEGREEERLKMAKKMVEKGMDIGDIMLYTGLSEQQILSL